MKTPTYKKILEHPDKDEIIGKLACGFSAKDVHDWLQAKYTNVSESKFVIAEKTVKSFQDNYLDIYNTIYADLEKTRQVVHSGSDDPLSLAVQNNPAYKNIMIKTAEEELDIRKTVKTLATAIETRLSQVFDQIQEDPRSINTKVDRLLIDYAEVFGGILEKYHKFTEVPASQIINNNNITLQVVDQHINVFHDVIKEVLSQMDIEASLAFIQIFNEKMNKLKEARTEFPNTEVRLAEAKLLNETINKKINE